MKTSCLSSLHDYKVLQACIYFSIKYLCASLCSVLRVLLEYVHIQVNAILLIVSLVSLAKSQCGRVGDDKKDKQTAQYLEVGK